MIGIIFDDNNALRIDVVVFNGLFCSVLQVMKKIEICLSSGNNGLKEFEVTLDVQFHCISKPYVCHLHPRFISQPRLGSRRPTYDAKS